MINKLSLATTYIQLFYMDANTGQIKPRSYATGFFISQNNQLWLISNWHVFSGLDPLEPAHIKLPPPLFAKITVIGGESLYELSIPLYNSEMEPIWREHEDRHKVDIAIYPLPNLLKRHFNFFDIQEIANHLSITTTIAKDAFILGYPFSKDEMEQQFGEKAPYYIPIWKRASIASEPDAPLGGRVILLDSLSRPGMSGAPVLISQEEMAIFGRGKQNRIAIKKISEGDISGLHGLDTESLYSQPVKKFKLLGIYSGVIGNTKIAEVALGKCWNSEALLEILEKNIPGHMPHHSPAQTDHYNDFLTKLNGRLLIIDATGKAKKTIDIL